MSCKSCTGEISLDVKRCEAYCGKRRCRCSALPSKKWCKYHYAECKNDVVRYHQYESELVDLFRGKRQSFVRAIRTPSKMRFFFPDEDKWNLAQKLAKKALVRRRTHSRLCHQHTDPGHEKAKNILKYFLENDDNGY